MNVILMRRARQFDEALLQNHLQTLQRAHGDLLVLSGRSACYAPVLALAGGLDIKPWSSSRSSTIRSRFMGPARWNGCSSPMLVETQTRASIRSITHLPSNWKRFFVGTAKEPW